MPDRIKLTDTNRFVRDLSSKGLLSTDLAGLGAYRNQRRNSEQVVVLERDINSLRDELQYVKNMLLDLMKGRHTTAQG
jgi:hypothetical protein